GIVFFPTPNACLQELTLERIECDFGRRRPFRQPVESRASQHVLVVSVTRPPLSGGSGELALQAEVLTARVDPSAKPMPFREKRFMGNCHGWVSSDGVVVEAHKAMLAEAFEHSVDR